MYPLHWHNAVELVYNTAGIINLNAAGMEYQLHEGDLFFIPSGEIHEITSCTKEGGRFFIQFNISALDGFGGISDIKPFMENIIKISKAEDTDFHTAVESCVIELINEYEKKEYAYALSVNARIFDILVLISRYLATKSVHQDSIGNGTKIAGLSKINRACDHIDKTYPSHITV
jgi:hypothetical protein